jgi:chemotaxis protein CheX
MGRFKQDQHNQTLTIYMPSSLDQIASDEFHETAKDWMLSPFTTFIFDFTSVVQIAHPFYRAMVLNKDALKKADKKYFSVGLSERLARQVRSDGMESAFNPVASAPASTATAARPKPLDVGFINPFLAATIKTLEVQCHTKIKVGKPYMRKEQTQDVVVASQLSLVSDGFQGSVLLCFPEKVFLKVYSNMFGEQCTDLTDDMREAAGELLNIIYGQAKTDLNQKGYRFPMALPKVLSAGAFRTHESKMASAMVIPFETDLGLFHLEIGSGP